MSDTSYVDQLNKALYDKKSPSSATKSEQSSKTEPSYFDMLNDALFSKDSPPPPTADERFGGAVSTDISGAADIHDVALASLAINPQAKIDYYSKQMNIPKSKFGVKDGQIVYATDDGKLQAVSPGFLRQFAKGLGPSFPVVGGAVGSLAGTLPAMPTGGASVLAGGMSGAALGETIRSGLSRSITGEKMTPTRITKEAALDFGATSAGLLISKGIKRTLAIKAAKELNRLMNASVTKGTRAVTEALAKVNEKYKTNIVLTPAETTNLATLKAQQTALGNVPHTKEVLEEFYVNRAKESENALYGYLKDLSPVDNYDEAGDQLMQFATRALKAIKGERVRLGTPAYEQSFRAQETTGPIDLGPVVRDLDDLIKFFPTYKDKINTVKDLLYRKIPPSDFVADASGIITKPTTTRVMHTNLEMIQNNVKDIMDDTISTIYKDGKGKLAGRLRKIQTKMLARIDEEIPKFGEARKLWGDLSRKVEFSEGGILTVLANKTAKDFEYMGSKMLANASPAEIKRARARIVALDGGEDVWNATVRGFLAQQWEVAGRVFKSTIGRQDMGEAAAPAALWAALVGNKGQYARVQAALSPDQRVAFDNLMTVFESTGRAANYNSTTAGQTIALEMLQVSGLGKMAIKTILNPVGSFRRMETAFDESMQRMNLDTLVQTLTRPDAVDRLVQISARGTSYDRAVLLAIHAIELAGRTAIAEERGGDIIPEELRQ